MGLHFRCGRKWSRRWVFAPSEGIRSCGVDLDAQYVEARPDRFSVTEQAGSVCSVFGMHSPKAGYRGSAIAGFRFSKGWEMLAFLVPDSQRRSLDELDERLDLAAGDSGAKRSAFWIILTLSGIIAVAGVVSDSTATVIGAMSVAPLSTPILTWQADTSVIEVLGSQDLPPTDELEKSIDALVPWNPQIVVVHAVGSRIEAAK